jgi:Arm DNA-binding domain
LALGQYPSVGLALARARAEEKRVEVSAGRDPQGGRRTKRDAERVALSFDALADAYLERYARVHKASWRNDELYLKAHVRPV